MKETETLRRAINQKITGNYKGGKEKGLEISRFVHPEQKPAWGNELKNRKWCLKYQR